MVTSVTGYTAAKMDAIAGATVVDGNVVGDNLILVRRDLVEINAGNVRGPQGTAGTSGTTSIVICTSTTRPTGGALFEGLRIYETDTDSEYIWSGVAWLYTGPKMPHTRSVRTLCGVGTGSTTSSTSYTDFIPGLSMANFVKYRADSSLLVSITGHVFCDSSNQATVIGVNLDGTITDVDVVPSDPFGTGKSLSGTAQITGLAAGTIALAKAIWKVTFGTSTLYGYMGLTITEVMV